jgi:hypothetical protein
VVLSFCAWLILLIIIVVSSIHVVTNNRISFFFVIEQYSIVHRYYISTTFSLSVHQLIDIQVVSIS